MSVLTDLRNRGVRDVFFLVCDGLKGLPDVVEHVWPQTVVQTCIIHLIRNTFRLSSRADHDALKKDLKAIYTAPTADAAEFALEELEEKWGKKYGRSSGYGATPGTSHPVLGLRRRNSARHLQHERHRKPQRPLPAGGAGPRAFPHRAGCAEVSVPCHPQPGPDRDGPHPMDDALEAGDRRLRHHVQ
jgi:hypothetical protein